MMGNKQICRFSLQKQHTKNDVTWFLFVRKPYMEIEENITDSQQLHLKSNYEEFLDY